MQLTLSREAYYEHTKALISLARSRGYLLFDELNNFLPESASSPSDLETALGLLGRLGIGVGETPEAALAAKAQLEPEYQHVEPVAKTSKDDMDVDLDSSDSD
ncbi:MAG TPA: RNA polymerase sigma factor region1.1 domain-containing protein, partial [Holophagaceae bacterium]|nr:RNA polymerase sigma factor region1.1 domain-containing protein [Holophagaceae bacterium]